MTSPWGVGGYRLELWDLTRGKRVQALPPSRSFPWGAAFSADERRIAIADASEPGNLRVLVWDRGAEKPQVVWSENRLIRERYFDPVVILSPDGKRLVACHLDLILRCWEVEGGKLLWESKQKNRSPFVPFSPDGRTVLTGAKIGNAGIQWRDAATGQLVEGKKQPPGEALYPLGFTPDGRLLALETGWEGVVLWEPEAGRTALRVPPPTRWRGTGNVSPVRRPTNFAFTPDGKALIRRAGTLQRWDLTTGKAVFPETANWGHTEAVTRLLFSPDGNLLASSARDQTVRLWEVATARTLHTFAKGLSDQLAFTPDGQHLFIVPPGVGRTALSLRSVRTGREERGFKLADRSEFFPSSRDKELRVTTDGRKILMLTWKNGQRGDESVLTVWNVVSGECLGPRRVPWAEDSLLTPDGRSVVAFDSATGTVRLLDIDTGWPRFGFDLDGVQEPRQRWQECDLTLSSNGRLLAARRRVLKPGGETEYDAIRLGDLATGRQLMKVMIRGPAVFSFSADSRLLAVAGVEEVQLWEIASGKAVGAIKVSNGSSPSPGQACADALALAPDGRTLATGHADSSILLWNATLRGGVRGGPLTEALGKALWADLGGPDTARAYASVWRFADDPAGAVAFLKGQLRPVTGLQAGVIRSLLDDLESDQFRQREAAEQKLRALGPLAEPALREALQANPSPERRRRLEAVLVTLDSSERLTGEALRQTRGVQVLELCGTAAARAFLADLTQGAPEARLTREAKASLERLARRPVPAP